MPPCRTRTEDKENYSKDRACRTNKKEKARVKIPKYSDSADINLSLKLENKYMTIIYEEF
jgi:hypothetical protein